MIHLAVASLVLSSQWVSIHMQEPIKQLSGVPALMTLHEIIPLEYPELPFGGSYRRKLHEIVHYESYASSNMDDE